jgi:hypothetical protein
MERANLTAIVQHMENPKRVPPPGCAAALKRDVYNYTFDSSYKGYTRDHAETVLCAMEANPEPVNGQDKRDVMGKGKGLYLNWHFPIDMVFPLLYGPALAAIYLYVLAGFGWQARWLKAIALVPIATTVLDLAENLTVRTLVAAGPPPDAGRVWIASALTMTKCTLLITSLAVALLPLLWYLARQSFSRPPSLG